MMGKWAWKWRLIYGLDPQVLVHGLGDLRLHRLHSK